VKIWFIKRFSRQRQILCTTHWSTMCKVSKILSTLLNYFLKASM